MPKGTYLFTSESVSEGHPDKVSDRISDAVVDLYLGADPLSRVACETLTTTNRIVLAGEVRGPESITKEMIEGVARDAVKDIGYEQEGFHWKNAEVEVHLHQQSVDIAQGVDAAGNKDEGAGDQGIMFGLPALKRRRSCRRRCIIRTKFSVLWQRRATLIQIQALARIQKAR